MGSRKIWTSKRQLADVVMRVERDAEGSVGIGKTLLTPYSI